VIAFLYGKAPLASNSSMEKHILMHAKSSEDFEIDMVVP
jgi:hypothetical protein